MPEPVLFMKWGVHLYRTPSQIPVTVEYIPVVIRNDAVLVAHPTNVAVLEKGSIREYKRVRLIHSKVLNKSREVVNVALAACSVEPKLNQVAVMAREFAELGNVIIVILGGIPVLGFMPVPWREVDAKLQSMSSRGF